MRERDNESEREMNTKNFNHPTLENKGTTNKGGINGKSEDRKQRYVNVVCNWSTVKTDEKQLHDQSVSLFLFSIRGYNITSVTIEHTNERKKPAFVSHKKEEMGIAKPVPRKCHDQIN